MKKHIRLISLIGAIILLLLYISTLIFALIDSPLTSNLLIISIGGTIFIPVILYVCLLFFRLNQRSDKTDSANDKNDSIDN